MPPAPRELDQVVVRRQKLVKLRQRGIDPYPAEAARTRTVGQFLANFSERSDRPETLVGRLRSLRLHGGACFGHLEDGSGRLQIYLKRDLLADRYRQWVELLDVGDFVEVRGKPMRTQRGEPTLLVQELRLLAKALRPLPEKWHGLSDVEVRYRRRELDLIANPSVRAIFEQRAALIRALRTFLDQHGFLEVETPILQAIPGGTLARPFATEHRALHHTFYLRIAPELYLKRLVVGGYERVYEIGRCFRNEGIDHLHNPEFTMVEFYAAYADDQWLLDFTEQLIASVLRQVVQGTRLRYGQHALDFQPPYRRLSYRQALASAGVSLDLTAPALKRFAKAKRLVLPARAGRGQIFDHAFKALVLPTMVQPTFVTDHPIELSPLAKQQLADPQTARRFQLLTAGLELVNAYAELNDPEEQRRRFLKSARARRAGDAEAHPFDPDYLEALETGLPPTAGWGLGLDRLAMLVANVPTLKEVLLFPTLKPKPGSTETYA